jgi:hypothetical protein
MLNEDKLSSFTPEGFDENQEYDYEYQPVQYF